MTDAALSEQLNGLIDLMKAVGIAPVDNRELKKASMALKNQGLGAPIVFPPDVPESKQLNDDQVQAMILKLQQAQAQAPQLMEALEDYIGQRNGGTSSRGTKKRTKKKGTGGKLVPLAPPRRDGHPNPQHVHQQYYSEPDYEEEEYVEEVIEEPPQNDHDDYDKEEEDDDFDENADYPMVGPGISDDVSVVSDMTTPTVVSSLHVNEEEQYADILPPMYVAGGGHGPPMVIQPQKRKNLVSQVGRTVGGSVPTRIGPSRAAAAQPQNVAGGAAAKRRQVYQQTMSKLHQNPYGASIAGPAVNPNVPVIHEEEDEPLTSNTYHGNTEFSFAAASNDWSQFVQPGTTQQRVRSNSLDEGADNASAASKPKKKATKSTKAKGPLGTDSTRSISPKPKKKKAGGGGTAIDRDGFLVGGEAAAGSPPGGKPKKAKDGLSRSTHSSASDGKLVKKKVVKKKVVKKSPIEGDASPPKPKKAPVAKKS